MRVSFYPCSSDYIRSNSEALLQVAREAFDNVPDDALLTRLARYPEVALAEDQEGIAGFVFSTTHRQAHNMLSGLRFLAVGDRCRNKRLTTLLISSVVLRQYARYLQMRLSAGGPKRLFIMARICNPKAFFTLTRGNAGVSPAIGSDDPSSSVRARAALYQWMEPELGLTSYDPQTGVVHNGAAAAGLEPKISGVSERDQALWSAYVPPGSEVMVLMPFDWRCLLNNALRFVRLLKPVSARRYE